MMDALRLCLEANSGQTGERLDIMMRVCGLTDPPLRGIDAADMLVVTEARVSQIRQAMRRQVQASTPPAGRWLPQQDAAERVAVFAEL